MLLQASSVSSLPRERLEKLFNDSVKKLKARDKELLNITAERDRLAAEQHEKQGDEQGGLQEEAAAHDSLKAELEVILFDCLMLAKSCHAFLCPSAAKPDYIIAPVAEGANLGKLYFVFK